MVDIFITFTLIMAVLAIIAGILILVWPKLLNYIVAIWLIVYGAFQLAIQLVYK